MDNRFINYLVEPGDRAISWSIILFSYMLCDVNVYNVLDLIAIAINGGMIIVAHIIVVSACDYRVWENNGECFLSDKICKFFGSIKISGTFGLFGDGLQRGQIRVKYYFIPCVFWGS